MLLVKTKRSKIWLLQRMKAAALIYLFCITGFGCVNNGLQPESAAAQAIILNDSKMKDTMKMKVEIWSDIMCPFCYIGKRKFEAALAQFPHKDAIEVEWKSYQLDPSIPADTNYEGNLYEYLSERKGISYEQSVKMHEGVTQMAKQVGLEYNFDKARIANSFKAHRLIQFAKTKGLGEKAEERLFLAYFTQGKNMGDTSVLIELGKEMGLNETEVNEALTNDEYAHRVKQDIKEGKSLGLTGVPFFILNRKYAVSGAQQPETFLKTLEKTYSEWTKEQPALQTK